MHTLMKSVVLATVFALTSLSVQAQTPELVPHPVFKGRYCAHSGDAFCRAAWIKQARKQTRQLMAKAEGKQCGTPVAKVQKPKATAATTVAAAR